MQSFQGTHGTSKGIAQRIISGGFQININKPGLRGSGIYFWENGPLAIKLAKGWVFFKKEHHEYSEKERGVVLFADLIAGDEEVVSQDQIKRGVERHVGNSGLIPSNLTRKEKGALYDLIISETEKRTTNKIKIFITETAPPANKDYFSFYDLQLFGAPAVYVVRAKEAINNVRVIEEF